MITLKHLQKDSQCFSNLVRFCTIQNTTLYLVAKEEEERKGSSGTWKTGTDQKLRSCDRANEHLKRQKTVQSTVPLLSLFIAGLLATVPQPSSPQRRAPLLMEKNDSSWNCEKCSKVHLRETWQTRRQERRSINNQRLCTLADSWKRPSFQAQR